MIQNESTGMSSDRNRVLSNARFWILSAVVSVILASLPGGGTSGLGRQHWEFGQPFKVCGITQWYPRQRNTGSTFDVTFLELRMGVVNSLIWITAAGVIYFLVMKRARLPTGGMRGQEVACHAVLAMGICVVVVNDLCFWENWASPALFILGASMKNQQLAQLVGVYALVPLGGAILVTRLLKGARGTLRSVTWVIVTTLICVILLGLSLNFLAGRASLYEINRLNAGVDPRVRMDPVVPNDKPRLW